MAGYSQKSLMDKLGLKPNINACFLNCPKEYFDELGIKPKADLELKKEYDFIHYFSKKRIELEKDFPKLVKHLKKTGMIWVSWPKKSSKIESDLDETVVRETGLACGVVDVKVCAVTDDWSGHKFVFRLKDR